jgi:LacI family repressor for deo operon, udp, cdd, tsx, nupC, and nupG
MANILDVARRAGVSTATVSRVLSQPALVSDATRAKVMMAVNALGYTPNLAAKTLRTLQSQRILLTVPDISNPFFSQVIRGVEAAAHAAGYAVILGDTRYSEEREERYADMFRRKETDGYIFLGYRLPTALKRMVSTMGASAPIVNGCEFSSSLAVSSVYIDNRRAASVAMQYLYTQGHTHIGVITGSLLSPISQDRIAGVRTCAARNKQVRALQVRSGDFTIASGLRAAEALLAERRRPTAIFCFSDEMAMGALEAVRRAGLRCPSDVSLIGFDDIRFSQYLDPPLTTIRQPMERIGREAVRVLLDILTTRSASLQRVILPYEFIIRSSTTAVKQSGPRTRRPHVKARASKGYA